MFDNQRLDLFKMTIARREIERARKRPFITLFKDDNMTGGVFIFCPCFVMYQQIKITMRNTYLKSEFSLGNSNKEYMDDVTALVHNINTDVIQRLHEEITKTAFFNTGFVPCMRQENRGWWLLKNASDLSIDVRLKIIEASTNESLRSKIFTACTSDDLFHEPEPLYLDANVNKDTVSKLFTLNDEDIKDVLRDKMDYSYAIIVHMKMNHDTFPYDKYYILYPTFMALDPDKEIKYSDSLTGKTCSCLTIALLNIARKECLDRNKVLQRHFKNQRIVNKNTIIDVLKTLNFKLTDKKDYYTKPVICNYANIHVTVNTKRNTYGYIMVRCNNRHIVRKFVYKDNAPNITLYDEMLRLKITIKEMVDEMVVIVTQFSYGEKQEPFFKIKMNDIFE